MKKNVGKVIVFCVVTTQQREGPPDRHESLEGGLQNMAKLTIKPLFSTILIIPLAVELWLKLIIYVLL